MAIATETEARTAKGTAFMKQLAEAGYSDALILEPGTVREVLTEKRIELLNAIEKEDIEGVRSLARKVGRDESNVHGDLTALFEAGLIEFEEEGNRKVPVIAHEHVFVKPIL